MSSAEKESEERNSEDIREFSTWYNNEDVQRIIWRIYQSVPDRKKRAFLKPYVFYDNMEKSDATSLDKMLVACHLILREHNLPFMPFIVKPRNVAHFYAGFIHTNPDYIYIFDPVGASVRNKKFRDCFYVSEQYKIANLPVVVFDQAFQRTEYEEGLVSCGPLSVEFLKYIMHSPEDIPAGYIPVTFLTPHSLSTLTSLNKTGYTDAVCAFRADHNRYLSDFSETPEFEAFYQDMNNILLNLDERDSTTTKLHIPVSEYTDSDVTEILAAIHHSIPDNISKQFIPPSVLSLEPSDLENELKKQFARIQESKELKFFPFLFKPKGLNQFCAGILSQTPCQIYFFIPNGMVDRSIDIKSYLGFSNKYFIDQIPLVYSKNSYPDFNVPSLLSIHFLSYMMQHETTYLKPQDFIDSLLPLHSHDYSQYIQTLAQQQKGYLRKQFMHDETTPSVHEQPKLNLAQTAEETYLQQFRKLSDIVHQTLECISPSAMNHPNAEGQALTLAIKQANTVLNELLTRLPVQSDGTRLLTSHTPPTDQLLLRLADLCSHVAQGLSFIAGKQVTAKTDLFRYINHTNGHLINLDYDLDLHRHCMQHISKAAHLLPGGKWERLKKALYLLAAALLVACGTMLLAGTPISLGLLVTLASTASVCAGIGFFVGHNTGIAKAASEVRMLDAELLSPRLT